MIVTHDILVAKGARKDLIDTFDFEFPSGFDFSNTQPGSTDYDLIDNLAKVMCYTGLYTHEGLVYLKQTNYINGLINDLPNGNPGWVNWNLQLNVLDKVAFYSGGKFQNPKRNIPAFIHFNSNGTVLERHFYENDFLNDPYPGVPAVIWYNPDGSIALFYHFKNGVRL